MKKLYAGVLGFGLTSAVALSTNAADWYRGPEGSGPYPTATWTGGYVGVNAGGGWGQDGDQLAFPSVFGGVQPSGGFGGLQAGYNWQGSFGYSSLVFGVEADIQVSSIQAERGDGLGLGDVYRSRLQDFGTVRGRLGYATDRTLLYFTGGFAYGNVRNEVSLPAGPADFIANPTATGYVLGGGLEYRLSRTVSIKAEYQYINLGANNPSDPSVGSYTSNGGNVRDDAFHTVRVGLNWYPFKVYEPLK
jgi:outer membrane immunogenic protein